MAAGRDLFREQAIDARRGQWLGAINLAVPLSRWVWIALSLALAAAIVLFLVFGQYTRREHVAGRLVPDAGLLGITATQAGTISDVFVHAGESVAKGDPLLAVSGERSSVALGGTYASISRQLRQQRERLRENLALQQQSTQSRKQALAEKLDMLRLQRQAIESQITLQKHQADTIQQLLDRVRPLVNKGYVSALQIQRQQASAVQAQIRLKGLRRENLALRQRIHATSKALDQLPLELAIHAHQIHAEIGKFTRELARNEATRGAVLRAPSDGVVSTIVARRGEHVAPGQIVASIMPKGAALEAQLLVPSRAAGFVQAGNRVVLRYQAYPYEKFGQQYGRVLQVSRSALGPEEVVALVGQRSKVPVYRVRVALDRQSIPVYGQPRALKAGMTLSADILMERRSLLEWAFAPLYGLNHQLVDGERSRG